MESIKEEKAKRRSAVEDLYLEMAGSRNYRWWNRRVFGLHPMAGDTLSSGTGHAHGCTLGGTKEL